MIEKGVFPLAGRPARPDDGTFHVDTTAWPLVLLTTVGTPSDQELQAHLDEIEERVLKRRLPFVQIVDQRKAGEIDAGQRAIIAQHQKELEWLYRMYCKGEAYVADAKLKGIMIAVFWQAKPAYPYAFFDGLDEAREWALKLLLEGSE